MKDKVCIVTGSNSGTGYAAAKKLAKLEATVVMMCRNEEKGKKARQSIIAETGNQKVDLIVVDLSDLSQVERAVRIFKSKYNSLDVLLNNAGGIVCERRITPQGLEETFAGNYLGPFLLTQLLLDVLIKSAPSRIINVSSAAHMYGKIYFDDLQTEKNYAYGKPYYQAKLAMIMSSYELAEQLQGTGVTLNVTHPGAVNSGFTNKFDKSHWLKAKFVDFVGNTPEKAAKRMVYLATSPNVENITGKYWGNCKEQKSSKSSRDISQRKRMWKETETILHNLGYTIWSNESK